MRFDYYQATIGGDASRNLAILAGLGDALKPAPGLARMYRYDQGYAVYSQGIGPVAHIFSGGQNGTVHGFASGEHTQAFERLVRAEWPDHRVTRADSAHDFNEPGAYEKVRAQIRPIAEQHRVSFLQYADDVNLSAGRTQYVGSPRSDVRLRLYEKGRQEEAAVVAILGVPQSPLRLLNTATGELVRPEDWTRIEAQVRPPDDVGKHWLASATPLEVWSCSGWLRQIAGQVLSVDLERFVMTRRKQTTVDRALRVMCSQYAKHLHAKCNELGGDWDALGVHLRDVITRIESEKESGVL